jgi:hypothetical protein
MMFLFAAVFMAIERLADMFDFYRFGLGALAYCVTQMRDTLDRLGFQKGVEYAERAKQRIDEALDKKYAWKQEKTREPTERQEGVQKIDDELDQTLSQLLNGLQVFAGMSEGTEKRRLAEEVIEDLFPEGVYPITSEKFRNQHQLVDKVTNRLRNRYMNHLETMSLTELVDDIEELNEEFGSRLAPDRNGVEYDEVQAAHKEAEDAFHRLVAVVVGEYAEDMETLNEVMTPVIEQTARTRRYMKRRGSVPPADPESGESVDPDDQAPTDGGSPDDESPDDEGTSNDGGSPQDESSNDGGSPNDDGTPRDGNSPDDEPSDNSS